MAEAQVGDITARLRIDTAEWQRGLQQAVQSLQQFGQAKDRIIANLSNLRQSLTQSAQTFQQFNTQINQTSQTFNQTNQTLNQVRNTFNQFNTQLNQTNQTFNTTNQTFNTFNTTINTTTNALNQARTAAGGFGGAWGSVLQIAGGIGLATSIQGIVSGLKDMVASSIQAAARMENLRAQFSALQGAGQGAATLQALFTTAQRLGVEFGTLATSFRGFSAATAGTALEGAKAQRVFEQITTGARAMGASSEQTGRALLALQQMVSKGTVSQEELRQQLGEALPGAMGIAARAFGVTTAEMNKMVEKGMDAVQFVQIFGNQVEREFAGKAATATNTLTTAWQRFSNELEQFQGALAGSALVNQLRDLANWAAELLKTMREARALREEAVGGAAPSLPPDLAAMSPEMRQRQARIEALRSGLAGGVMPDWMTGFLDLRTDEQLEKARTELLALQKQQREQIARMQEQLAAETVMPPSPSQLPGARTTEAMRKIQEDLQKTLREIDLTAAFVTPLELAEARLKAIEDSFKRMQEEARRLGAGLRESLTPAAAKPSPYDDLIAETASRHGIPYNIARALVQKESGFQAGITSPAGAIGLTQVMPGTARQMGYTPEEMRDPAKNLDAGLKYLAQLLEQFKGDWQKALTAYNAGPGRGGIPLPTGENATYATDVLRIAGPARPGTYLSNLEAQRRAAEAAVEAQQPDTARQAEIRRQGQEFLRQQEQARIQIPQLEGQLAHLQALAGQVGQSAAAQASAAVLEQGRTVEVMARRSIEAIADNPAIGRLAPQLRAQLEQALVGFHESVVQQAAEAGQKANERIREQLRATADQVTQIGLQAGAAGVSRLDAEVAQVQQKFTRMRNELEAADRALTQRRREAAPEDQGTIQAEQARIAALQTQMPGLEEAAITTRTEAFGRQMRDTIAGIDDQAEQLAMRLNAAGLDPLAADLARIDRSFVGLFDKAQSLSRALAELSIGATDKEQASINAVRERLGLITETTVELARQAAILERITRDENAALRGARERLDQEREEMTGGSRESARMRQRFERSVMTPEGKREAEAMVAEQEQLERLQQVLEMWHDLSSSVGSAWVQALESIADGTKTVSEAFEQMAKSIIRSMGEIAANQATQALFKLGVGLITSALMPAASGGGFYSPGLGAESPMAVGAGINPVLFQHGGVINAPTMAMLGENPANNPEVVMNRQQMQSMFGGPAANQNGGAGISIHNYPDKASAEAGAARSRANGEQAIVNAVLNELSAGEGSKINRALRVMQR